jgi:hypothetical protein
VREIFFFCFHLIHDVDFDVIGSCAGVIVVLVVASIDCSLLVNKEAMVIAKFWRSQASLVAPLHVVVLALLFLRCRRPIASEIAAARSRRNSFYV